MSCQTDDFVEEQVEEYAPLESYIHDQPANDGVACALAKARMVAGIEWTPISIIPSVYSDPYSAGIMRKGLPYSLAQKVNGYVGLDVSFYTFLTAIHNPYSVMYTENLRKKPYFGFDCAPYYGSVCATSVWYVLGIKAPYYTSAINAIPDLKRREDLSLDSIKLCDVLWKNGHVAMIYDIAREEGNNNIKKVTIFETTTSNRVDSHLKEFTYDDYVKRWKISGWVIYRPKDLSNNTFNESSDFNAETTDIIPLFRYNDDICTSRGDCVAYPLGDEVIINILSKQYNYIEVYRDGELYEKRDITSTSEIFKGLPYGDYKARLVSGDFVSDYTYFEVIDINVSHSGNEKITVFFSSKNANPEFMSLGDERECPYYCYIFSEKNKKAGSITVNKVMNYLKVHFRGKYGRVSSKLIYL